VGLWVQQAISGLVETARSEATGAAANRDAAGQAQPVVSRQQLQHDVKDLMHEVFSALRDRRDEARTVLTGSEVSANAAAKTPISPTGAAVGSTPASPQAVGTTAVAAAAMHDVTTDQTKGTSDPQLTVDADMARRGAAASPGTARPYGMGAGFADRLSGLIDEVAAGRAPGALQSAFDTLMRDLGVQSAGTSLTQRTAAMVTFPMNATAGDAGTSPDLHAVDTPWRADAGAPAQAAKPAITVGRNMADDEGLSFAAGGTGSLLSSSAAALQAFLERLRAPMATEGGAMRTGHFLNVSA
jgi:hypothetical protein